MDWQPPKDKGIIILAPHQDGDFLLDGDKVFNLATILVEHKIVPSKNEARRKNGSMFIKFWFPDGSPQLFCTRNIMANFAFPSGTEVIADQKNQIKIVF